LGRHLGVDRYINLKPAQNAVTHDKTVADTVEALVGAVWIDRGYSRIERVEEVRVARRHCCGRSCEEIGANLGGA